MVDEAEANPVKPSESIQHVLSDCGIGKEIDHGVGDHPKSAEQPMRGVQAKDRPAFVTETNAFSIFPFNATRGGQPRSAGRTFRRAEEIVDE
jgi:hypothetical protein